MSLQWDGKYKYEAGDVVEVINNNHPFLGRKSVVSVVFSTEQFGVSFVDCRISLWADDLQLISTHRESVELAYLEQLARARDEAYHLYLIAQQDLKKEIEKEIANGQ